MTSKSHKQQTRMLIIETIIEIILKYYTACQTYFSDAMSIVIRSIVCFKFQCFKCQNLKLQTIQHESMNVLCIIGVCIDLHCSYETNQSMKVTTTTSLYKVFCTHSFARRTRSQAVICENHKNKHFIFTPVKSHPTQDRS